MDKLKHAPAIGGIFFALVSMVAVTTQIGALGGRVALWGATSALVVLAVSLSVSLCQQRQDRREAQLREKYEAIINDLADATLLLSRRT
jgi:cytochrome c-type biogenesis protein CcmH/NrfF